MPSARKAASAHNKSKALRRASRSNYQKTTIFKEKNQLRKLRTFSVAAALVIPMALLPTATATADTGNTCEGRQATILGTSGNDVIYGTSGNDVIVTFGGDDTIYAGAGNDVVCADGVGQVGNDRIFGQDGDDSLHGGMGNDYQVGGPGADASYGGPGDDHLIDDTLVGANGSKYDSLVGNDGDDLIDARAGDYANGFTVGRYLEGDDGNDTIYGSNYGDNINGGNGNDKIYGLFGYDQINGGAGNDYLSGGNNYYDYVDGSTGTDTCTGGRLSNCEA
jgi:Ca2+-binding RTX toxin-like protein